MLLQQIEVDLFVVGSADCLLESVKYFCVCIQFDLVYVFSFSNFCFALGSVRRTGPLIEVGNFQSDSEHIRSIGEAKRLAIQFGRRLGSKCISANQIKI